MYVQSYSYHDATLHMCWESCDTGSTLIVVREEMKTKNVLLPQESD